VRYGGGRLQLQADKAYDIAGRPPVRWSSETEVATAPRAWKAGAELLMATAILAHPEADPRRWQRCAAPQPDVEARTE
jgi:hypothetical protein